MCHFALLTLSGSCFFFLLSETLGSRKVVSLFIPEAVAKQTEAEDVLGIVVEPGHSQCCVAVHAASEQRWSFFL